MCCLVECLQLCSVEEVELRFYPAKVLGEQLGIEILVKAARRPWALERLLVSLETNLKYSRELRISVVDDRTDERYLSVLKERFPNVDFGKRSEWGDYKRGKMTLPYVQAWQDKAREISSKYLLVIEDDQWLTGELDLDEVEAFMDRESILSLNFAQELSGMESVEFFDCSNSGYLTYIPSSFLQAPSNSEAISRPLIDLLSNPNPIARKFAGVLTLLSPNLTRPLWRSLASVNPMAGAVFDRQHWMYMWGGKITWINENIQISRVLKRLRTLESPTTALAINKKRLIATTYVSTTSLTLGTQISWDSVNRAISDAWLLGEISMPAESKDWDKNQLSAVIETSLGVSMKNEYQLWCDRFARMHLLTE